MRLRPVFAPRSLRVRLLLVGGAVALAALLSMNALSVGGMVIYLEVRNRQLIDANRVYEAAQLSYDVRPTDTTLINTDPDGVVLVLLPNGVVLNRIGVTANGLTVPSLPTLRDFASDGQFRLFNGLDYYGVVDVIDDGRFVITARSLAHQRQIAGELLGLMFGLDVVICAAALGLHLSLNRLVLRPLERMAATAGRIAGGDLKQRVDLAGVPTEVAQLGLAMNQMLAQIENSFSRLSEVDQRLRQFIADASHELRTPLTVILGYAQLLRLGGLTDSKSQDEAMLRVEREARRLSALAEQLLMLAHLDQGKCPANQRVDLDSLCRDVVAAALGAHHSHPLAYRCDGEPPIVLGDEPWLRQVLSSLLANVRMHTPTGTHAEIRLSYEPPNAVIDVIDQGPGIPAGDRQQVFERFFRGDSSRQRMPGEHGEQGSGLGLSMVLAVVTAHNGTVTVQPCDSGAWVQVRVPAEVGQTERCS